PPPPPPAPPGRGCRILEIGNRSPPQQLQTEEPALIRRRRFVTSTIFVSLLGLTAGAQPRPASGPIAIQQPSLKEWLTYLASDELQGRATYSEGLGLAAQYIADHLKQWGVKPVGDNGTYFQIVKVLGVRTTSHSTVTVEVNGQTRTFRDGEGITFPRNMGGRQTIVADQVYFAGYGLSLAAAQHEGSGGADLTGKAVVWLGTVPPSGVEGSGRLMSGRSREALERGAVATIGPHGGEAAARWAGQGGGRSAPGTARSGRGGGDDGDFTTVQRLDRRIPPSVTAQDEFFEFLFSGSDVSYADLKARADRQEPLAPFSVKGVKLTFQVDAEYEVTRTRFTRNVVGVVEGSDPKLRHTYVVYGAHYDHTGYREGVPGQGRAGRAGRDPYDRIYNGADDDGSGTVAIMAVARAFASGPRPKRSLLFVWHAGEESGLLGSRYSVEFPVVPLENMVAQINLDMVGRNRNNDPSEANTVYVVGADRISTELHNINEAANASLARPLMLDYEYNDPADAESFYTRSDHYSYAEKGIPIIFYFTGTHPDYHAPSDTVDKIIFDKVQRIAQLAYETGRRVANLERPPARDNKGPRKGKGERGRID
ncbi:MAG TPA: M28 family peptidase, partial [Vicinamibacterales bacterium]|nr:M28 family peptidase [Vicinamibacterales bacterium]